MAHQWIHVNQVKGIYHHVFLEVWPHHPEDGFHVHALIIKAMFSFVEIHREQLYEHRIKSLMRIVVIYFRLWCL